MFHIIIIQFFISKYNLLVMIIMNKNNRLKPNLLDPVIKQKIIKTLNPVKEDYWEWIVEYIGTSAIITITRAELKKKSSINHIE